MTFRETVYECILLAHRAEIEYVRRRPQQEIVLLGETAKDLPEMLQEAAEVEKPFVDFLKALPDAVVMKLQTFMYFGRDGGPDMKDLHAHLAQSTPDKEDAIRTMREKTPLAEYLVQALLLAEKNRLDIEADF